MSQVNRFAPHGAAGPLASRIDGHAAGLPLTVVRATITRDRLAERGVAVAADDALTAAHVVLREFPWSDDALAHADATVTAATLGSPPDPDAAFGCAAVLDADASAATRTPCAYALYLTFRDAGVVLYEAGTIAGRSAPAAYVPPATLTPSVTPILLTA